MIDQIEAEPDKGQRIINELARNDTKVQLNDTVEESIARNMLRIAVEHTKDLDELAEKTLADIQLHTPLTLKHTDVRHKHRDVMIKSVCGEHSSDSRIGRMFNYDDPLITMMYMQYSGGHFRGRDTPMKGRVLTALNSGFGGVSAGLNDMIWYITLTLSIILVSLPCL